MVLSMDRWIGKVAVVIGASGGIGSAIATQLVEKGIQVAGLDINADGLDKLSKASSGKKGKFSPVKADLTKEEDISNAFKWVKENLGPVHILINAAGYLGQSNLYDGDSSLWRKVFQVNVIAMCIAAREALRDMKANNVDGHIININSIIGHQIIYYPRLAVYGASKYAVTALTETLRLELNSLKLKVKVTSISPGGVDTEFISEEFKVPEVREKLRQEKYLLEPEQIADAIVYALSTPPHVQTFSESIAYLTDTTSTLTPPPPSRKAAHQLYTRRFPRSLTEWCSSME